ncbi:hypothetical protein CLCHR_46740 [Clostridium chromiireducens]|uniref:Uncharacterized protein n=1 Tax=Clostridium chromiireducens TaxID=225345 RepID=A0A1V4I7F7_9CLOT|nr:hypothetical protein CLCHR_46740 [Clostridium chromiireducens]
MVLKGKSAISERKLFTNVLYTSSEIIIIFGLSFSTMLINCLTLSFFIATEGGLLGLTINKAFILVSFSLFNSDSGYCQVCVPSLVNSVALICTISKL